MQIALHQEVTEACLFVPAALVPFVPASWKIYLPQVRR
jgi:hypothetical protein